MSIDLIPSEMEKKIVNLLEEILRVIQKTDEIDYLRRLRKSKQRAASLRAGN